jgi:hypothetical protein
MRRLYLIPVLALVGCAPGGYTRAEVVYAEPARYVYVVPPERVVIVTREVLVSRGYVVYRVQQAGPNRIVWARRGDDEIVRVFVSPERERVVVRGLSEARDRDRRKRWVRRGNADEVISEVDVRLRGEKH